MKPYYEDDACTIYHGDCREILPGLGAESVHVIWTDPPYGHRNGEGDLQAARVGIPGAAQKPVASIENDGAGEMRAIVDFMLGEAARILRHESCCCCCCCCGGGPRPTFAWLAERMDREGMQFFHSVIWDKRLRGPGLGWRFRRDHEMVMVAHRKGGKLRWNEDGGAVSNILSFYASNDRVHPNEKPLELVSAFLSKVSNPGDLVLDPFMGSGTTLRAAKDLGRKAIGIELEEKYCEIAARRLGQEMLF